MFSTLRGQLTLTLIGFLCVMAVVIGLWVNSAQQHMRYYKRGQYANEALQGYMDISINAYRYFKQLGDNIILGKQDKSDIIQARRNVQRSLDRLRAANEKKTETALDDDDQANEITERDRVAQLASLIGRAENSFNISQSLPQDGERTQKAWMKLDRLLEETIDGEFQAIIDAAIADERGEVIVIETHDRTLLNRFTVIAIGISWLAIIATTFIVLALFRRLRTHIDLLSDGARRLASGDLGHRIHLRGAKEFVQLADSFNSMSQELEKQRADLLETHAMLETRVRERTAELDAANGELVRLDKVRRNFFADISHELRTPLTIIRGEAEVTLRGKDKAVDEYKNALSRIVELAKQLGRLVNDLLLLARSASHTNRLELSAVSLEQILREVREETRTLIRQQGLTLALHLPDREITVKGDCQRLKQVFLALLDNALRYAERRSKIELELSAEGRFAVIAVRDYGVGIEASELPHVFERFYRGKQAHTVAPQGTGLGLPVAKSIVEAHEGQITIISDLGAGTTVTVRLPLLDVKRVSDYAHSAG